MALPIILRFSRTTDYTGLSGHRRCSGVELLLCRYDDGSEDNVMITAMTRKGQIGRCDITVPLEDLNRLIDTLISIRDEPIPTPQTNDPSH